MYEEVSMTDSCATVIRGRDRKNKVISIKFLICKIKDEKIVFFSQNQYRKFNHKYKK